MAARILSSIASIPAAQWNALDLGGSPFVRHEFLLSLERESCVGPGSGWVPQHLVLQDSDGRLEGAMPVYRKTDSWGEFVFDWSWAKAYAQAGLRYYPKLVSMTPFTPATGPRLLVATTAQAVGARERLSKALLDLAKAQGLSSAHVLFVNEVDRTALGAEPYLWRKDCQFHWRNRGYRDFDAFLATFRAEKRKKALRERRRIIEAGIRFRTLAGEQIDSDLWDLIFGFSAATFESRGHEHYLNAAFFKSVSAALPGAVVVKLAELHGQPIATAIFFRSNDTLYGRYWGAAAEFHSLHFEPTETWSAHWIADPRFQRAIDSYLDEERAAVDQYICQVREHVPFRRDFAQRGNENAT